MFDLLATGRCGEVVHMLVVIVVLRAFSEISSQSHYYEGRISAKVELYARIFALVKQPRSGS